MASTKAQGRVDSHLHVWASPQETADKYPYFPDQEPTLPGHLDILLQCMEEASVDGALIVQPINHKFDLSLVTNDFPFVVPESGYKGANETVIHITSQASLSSSEVEWIAGKTAMQLFQGQWLP
ncbi:hydrolase isoform 2 [Hibiscus syriacus]|uniref:Hydrolase isoform 2 n=1 Tax=Hibiscus syriacus TaxID=106335 RepID=A0A6A2Z5V5_HIBSY|nr:hydrolase isoform 2 [Hibiscus syriacus]